MTFQWHNLLGFGPSTLLRAALSLPKGGELSRAAADDDGGLVNILILVVMMVIGLVGHLIKKAQEKQQVDQADSKVAEAKRRQVSSPHEAPPPRRRPTAAEQVVALHSAVATKAKPPPPPARAELAQGVREEVRKVRQHLLAEQTGRGRRLVHIEALKLGIGPETAPAETPSGEKPKIRLNLSNPKAARTAIICAEVLGLPKALRSDPEPWEQ